MNKPSSGPGAMPDLASAISTSFKQRPFLEPTFVKYHLAIDAQAFYRNLEGGMYPALTSPNNQYPGSHLQLSQVLEPKAEDFLYYLQRVGGKYGWDKRKKYQKDNMDAVRAFVERPGTCLYVFAIDGKQAGFALVTRIDNNHEQQPLEKGIMKPQAIETYRQQKGLPDGYSPVEIYKIGLFDEFTNQGYGNYFLQRLMKTLFEKGKGIVYLDTRDTNHEGVLRFYAQNGVDVFYQEELSRDVVFDTQNWPRSSASVEFVGPPYLPAPSNVNIIDHSREPGPVSKDGMNKDGGDSGFDVTKEPC
ncbi:MAG: GNAT family N-acetyltransferase [Alphaproteobacteria bacterium]|nr:GNAT family N-acetyltransferase [Alphaproteobacteria bacterium]